MMLSLLFWKRKKRKVSFQDLSSEEQETILEHNNKIFRKAFAETTSPIVQICKTARRKWRRHRK